MASQHAHTYLDFEKPIAEIEGHIEELRHRDPGEAKDPAGEIVRLERRLERLVRETYGGLDAWQKVQVARHPGRPHCLDYVRALLADFVPLAGDRAFGDDPAVIGGMGRLAGRSIMLLGHERGADIESRVKHNFGMARPEGYRKAIRLMRLAERFAMPVVALIDTPGAYPGVDAEARGQAEAIARAVETCLDIKTPLVAVVIGEGGSGGAIALGAGDRVLMAEHAVYSVISPEGCASILWRAADQAKEAAGALKLTAQDLLSLGVIDAVIPEPMGAAHRDPSAAIAAVGEAIGRALEELAPFDGAALRARRRDKFLAMGQQG